MDEKQIDRNITYGVAGDLTSKAGAEMTDEIVEKFVSETKKWIGREIPLDEEDKFRARQPVDASEIRRYALTHRNPNPLYVDPDYAKTTRWGGIIAPANYMHTCYSTEVTGTVPVQFPGLLQAQHWLQSGIGLEFFVPIRVGDLVQPKVIFNDIQVTTGSFIGKMFLNSTKTIVKNQKGEVIGTHKHYDMLYSVAKAKEKKVFNFPPEQGYPPLKHEDLGRWNIKRRGATPLYYEDVNVGDELPPINYGMTVMDIVGTMSGIRCGLEYPQERGGLGCHWHYHPVTCFQVRGMPLPFDSGQSRYGFSARLITDWAGDNCWVWKMDIQLRKPCFAGDSVVVKGKVAAKNIIDGRHCLDVFVTYENQRNETIAKGTVVCILPSKKGDAPLLPEQPKL